MKKFFVIFTVLCIIFSTPAFSASRTYKTKPILTKSQVKAIKKKINERKSLTEETSSSSASKKSSSQKGTSERVRRQNQIRDIGYKLLNSNEIDKRMTFGYSLAYKDPNAYASLKSRQIVVNKGLMDMITKDDELAFILGHEISHAIDSYWGPLNGLFYNPQFNFVHRRIESRCDLRSIDFMVKAGYNPVAGLIITNKLIDQPVTDYFRTHPMGTKRLATMYVYIKNTYPEFLKENEYTKDPVYQNILLTCQKDIEKLEEKLKEEAEREILKEE